jgi:hypothetical protein
MNAEPTLSQHEFETFTRMLEDNVGLYLGKEKEYLIWVVSPCHINTL